MNKKRVIEIIEDKIKFYYDWEKEYSDRFDRSKNSYCLSRMEETRMQRIALTDVLEKIKKEV